MYIGFNITKAEELVTAITKDYNALGQYTAEEWESLKKVLRTEWVGPDEQAYEQTFVKRLCDLNVKAYNLADACVKTIERTTDTWIKFQNKNTVDGKTTVDLTGVSMALNSLTTFITGKGVKLNKNDEIVRFVARTDIDLKTNRGLRDSSSRVKIQSAVETFVKAVQARTKKLFESIQTNRAFYGDQSSVLKNYIEKTGDSIGIVTTSIKDLNDALNKLANSAYTGNQSTVTNDANKSSRTMDSMANSLGSSRWV